MPETMSEKMNSRVAIVTGGASGIGLVLARALAENGYSVVVADMQHAEAAAEKLRDASLNVVGVRADVTDVKDVNNMVAVAAATYGGLDVLVNYAGIFTSLTLKPFGQITPAEWMKVMEVNTLGPFLCAKAALPALRARGGRADREYCVYLAA
jgi:NAD(P)-dependent dehydrogenase (short-subunit alcohol dehydrogenase family)